MNLSKDTSIRLVQECKLMCSRLSAILNCDVAIEGLSDEDVFGNRYPDLLRGDIVSMTEAIEVSERELGRSVALPQ